jgi:hypothetical protein
VTVINQLLACFEMLSNLEVPTPSSVYGIEAWYMGGLCWRKMIALLNWDCIQTLGGRWVWTVRSGQVSCWQQTALTYFHVRTSLQNVAVCSTHWLSQKKSVQKHCPYFLMYAWWITALLFGSIASLDDYNLMKLVKPFSRKLTFFIWASIGHTIIFLKYHLCSFI